MNKKYLPEGFHELATMIHGAYKSYQDGNSNLVATVWKDNRTVRLVSTNSNPRNVVHTDRRLGHNVIELNQPQNVQLYNRNMSGADHHDQMHRKYDVGLFSVKAWKYILWYFVNTSKVNDYILYCKTSMKQTKEIAMGLIAGFSSRKRKTKAPLYIGPVTAANKNNHENVHMGSKKEGDVNDTVCSKLGKKLYMGVSFAMYSCVQMDTILPTIINNIKL